MDPDCLAWTPIFKVAKYPLAVASTHHILDSLFPYVENRIADLERALWIVLRGIR